MSTGSLVTPRWKHSSTLLPDGEVLVAGGADTDGFAFSSAELYNPASGTWTSTGDLKTGRHSHTATLLPGGKVLVAAGRDNNSAFDSAELYDVGLGFSSDLQPVIDAARSTSAHRVELTGSHFQDTSQGSGGNFQDSSTNYPVVQLRAIDNEQVTFLLVDPFRGWSDTSFSSLPARSFVSGPALVTVFTNGIPSASKYFVVPPSE